MKYTYYLVVLSMIMISCKSSSEDEIKPKKETTNNIPENTIVFNVKNVAGPKNGKIGFLSSVTTVAPADDYILPLKPYIWRVGRANDAFSLYPRLNRLGVKKQLLIVSDFRNVLPTSTTFKLYGYGVLADTLATRAKNLGFEYEWDLFNEPNDSLKTDFNRFMTMYWNPAYRAIKSKFPDAVIHGPSLTINNFGDTQVDSALVYKFIDAAIVSNTLPDYINWHFQAGYNIADWHGSYAKSIKNYLSAKGKSIKGFVAGETVRPGDERNTSPAVLTDVFVAQEVHDITQIHAAWTSTPVYGVQTSNLPVLGGLLANTDGTGRRGAWWTYEFYGRMKGKRLVCENQESGNRDLVGLAFRDDDDKKIMLMIGVRDPLGTQKDRMLSLTNLDGLEGLIKNEKVHVKIWHNRQTRGVVSKYNDVDLPLIRDADMTVEGNKLSIPFNLPKWDALLIEITKPI